MRVYTYSRDIYGEGGVRLAGPDVVPVETPAAADVLVCPQALFALRRTAAWARFWDEPEVRRRPERVVVLDISEHWPIPPLQGCLYFWAPLTAANQRLYPSAIAWPWPAPDLGWVTDGTGDARDFDVTFHGWKSPLDLTVRAVASIEAVWTRRMRRERLSLALHQDFHGHRERAAGVHAPGLDPTLSAETVRRETGYRDGLRRAWFALAPDSAVGVPRYRVYEALAAGRIPLVVGEGHVWPFADRIPWAEILLEVPAAHVDHVGQRAWDWLQAESVAARRRREARAREAYATWLDKARFAELMTLVVRERLAT